MKHVAAFPPRLEKTGLSAEERDSLPWLRDVPTRVRRPGYWRVLIVILAVSADAIASYAAGRAQWSERPRGVVVSASAQHMRALAERVSSAGWYRPRPGAPY